MLSQAELSSRRGFYFRNTPFMPIHKMITITEHTPSNDIIRSSEIMVGWLVSMEGGFKHAFIEAQAIDFDFRALLADKFPMKHLYEIVNDVKMTWGSQNPLKDERGDLKSAPFTNRVYIFTGPLKQERSEIRELFRAHGLEAVIVDDERWRVEWDGTPADVFICHDSRDKPRYARPLHDELAKKNLKVWLDEFAIRPGNDVVERIDHGLRTSRHALIVLTQRFLKNDRWASQEMSALLSRQFGTRQSDLIIPLYIGVSWNDVCARSPLLAKAAPVRTSRLNFGKRIQNVVGEICRTVQPGHG